MSLTPARILNGVLTRALLPVNALLHRLECGRQTAPASLPFPPVFILGAPRSGSTVLSQLMLRCFDFGYFSNLHNRLYGGPSLVERIFPTGTSQAAQVELKSVHGVAPGLRGPSEAGDFWYRFFPSIPPYVPLERAEPKRMNDLRNSLAAFGSVVRRPLLFKNLYCSFRIGPLAAHLPEARYIVIRREIADQAHSILETRKKVYGDYETWWSMEPPEIEQLQRRPPGVQVVEQIRSIHTLIDRDLARSQARSIELDYEALCDNPQRVMQSLESFFRAENIPVVCRNAGIAPLKRRAEMRIDPACYQQVVDHLGKSKAAAAA